MGSSEEKIAKLEVHVENHEERIVGLEEKFTLLHRDLGDLKNLLSNIKWWVAGIGTFYIAEQTGILPLVKALLGI